MKILTKQRAGQSLRLGRPIWLAAGNPRPKQRYPTLTGSREVDVAIIGGGMTGGLAAWAFAEAGVSIAVLEGALVGCGSTAASSALLLHEPDKGMAELAERYGPAASRRIWRLTHDAVRDFVKTLRRLRISCDLAERDAIHYATNGHAAARLQKEFELRARAGFEDQWLTPGALRRATGIAGHGAIRSKANAQFNPYEACLGLTAGAAASGAAIFERSLVTRIDRRRNRIRLNTSSGRVDAACVVIATGYATTHFRPLAGRFRMYRSYVLVTQPVGADARRDVGLGDVMIWDTERPYHYARWTADHRLLFGGADRPVRRGARRDTQFATATSQLQADMEALLPGLAHIEVDHAWEGLFAITADSLPFIGPHPRYPRHLFALGYGGNGMTFGMLAARTLVQQWKGIRSPDHRLFRFGRIR